MIGDYMTAQLLFEDRLRDAERRRAQHALLSNAAEQTPDERQVGLLHRLKVWMHVEKPQAQGANDARHAHAL
jgi:hypothetical protein